MILIIAFISVAFAYYFIQKDKIKRAERQGRMKRKQEELLERLRSNKKFDS